MFQTLKKTAAVILLTVCTLLVSAPAFAIPMHWDPEGAAAQAE